MPHMQRVALPVCSSFLTCLALPARASTPAGAGIVAARTPKKVLQMAGIEDCYTCSRGSTRTLVRLLARCWCLVQLCGTAARLLPSYAWRQRSAVFCGRLATTLAP